MRLSGWLAVALLLGAAAARGEEQSVSTRFATGTPDAAFTVDGQPYSGAALFLWPAGSQHTFSISSPQFPAFGTRYDCAPPPVPQPVRASADLPLIGFACTTSYRVQVNLAPPGVASPGVVCGVDHTAEIWVPAGTGMTCSASANSGYVFVSWGPVPGRPGGNSNSITFTVDGPLVVQPVFNWAVPVQVSIDSWPSGLRALIDRAPAPLPMNLEWGWTSSHSLGADPVQQDSNGNYWAFDSWSDGGDLNHDVTVPSAPGPLSFVARFVPAYRVTFLTDPPLLRLNIDGRENWPNYTFVWAAGSRHSIGAAAEQVDGRGRKFAFRGWSDGQAASHELVVAQPPQAVRYTAAYEALNQIRVTTDPPGVAVGVDGQDCATPCVVDRAAGAAVRIAAPASAAAGAGTRLAFQSWADGGGRERTVMAAAEVRTLTARYGRQYQLQLAADPPDGVAWRVTPAAADGYYDEGTRVGVAADALPGFRFLEWGGDGSGTRPAAVVTMTGVKSLLARLDAVPYIFPDGVQNAAGPTPLRQSAPRSLVSVFGRHLAPRAENAAGAGPAESLAGVSVWIDEVAAAGLLMVSEGQVNLQLPEDLAPGAHRLRLLREGQPETSAAILVARHAPGLFGAPQDGRAVGVFARESGEPVTAERPADAGEMLVALGTGLGAQAPGPLDAVELVAGETAWQPLEAAPGRLGIDALRFRVPAGLAAEHGYAALRLRVNGVESNAVYLPLR